MVPKSFLCPITHEIMDHPVLDCVGNCYEKAAIENWFRQCAIYLDRRRTSPLSNEELATADLLPNRALKSAIQEWRESRAMSLDPSTLEVSEEVLGEGSLGVVVAGALNIGESQRPLQVAVKRLPGMTSQNERQAFDRELKVHMHALLQCSGVCGIYGTCEIGQPPRQCLVMKRYQRSLHDVIKDV